jgi:heme-degrading monooxygenase HmoA
MGERDRIDAGTLRDWDRVTGVPAQYDSTLADWKLAVGDWQRLRGILASRHIMIARHWRGWTEPGSADAYESLLKNRVLPGLKQVPGYRGGYVLRSNGRDEAEFVVINFFDSLEAVKAFAGEDYAVAVFEPEARALLSRVEPVANHYEVRVGSVS